jgi:tetratricopeptide (TPR) repeat protein
MPPANKIAIAVGVAWAALGPSAAADDAIDDAREVREVSDGNAELERGLARFQAGEFAAAIGPLRAANAAAPSDLDTALLLAIAYYRCGDVGHARPLLIAAAGSPDPETRDSAQIFLGLAADATGDADAALGYYDSVARGSSSLADSGRALSARGRGERLSAALVIRPEFDSNVALQPATAAAASGSAADRDVFVLADLHARPFVGIAVVLDEALAYRKQAAFTEFDMASSVSGLTWSHRGPEYRAALGYHVDLSMLGGALLQVGQTADAGARRAIAGGFGIAASYQLAIRTLYPDVYAGYSGAVQTGTARLSWLADTWELELGAVVGREATEDPALTALAAGGQLAARIRLGRADLRAFARATDRRYDAASQGRRDLQVRADASLYVDLTPHLGAVLGGALLDDRSNAMDEGYVKWTGYLGLVVATGP